MKQTFAAAAIAVALAALPAFAQNNAAKTTIAPYSMRGIDRPTVSTPLTWDEVESATKAADLRFETDDVLGRLEKQGDLLADMPDNAAHLP